MSVSNIDDLPNVPAFARSLGFDRIEVSRAVPWERMVNGKLYRSENIVVHPGQVAEIDRTIAEQMAEYR